jgi:hypothetical protein
MSYRLSIQPAEIQEYIISDEFIVWTDLTSDFTRLYLKGLLCLFVLIEMLSVTLIYLTLSSLRNKTTKLSQTNFRLIRQLNLLLACEFITPLILVIAPMSIHMLRAMGNEFPRKEITQVGLIWIGLYGVVNALLTIFFVGPYRIYFVNTFIFPIFKILKLNRFLSDERISHVVTIQVRSH